MKTEGLEMQPEPTKTPRGHFGTGLKFPDGNERDRVICCKTQTLIEFDWVLPLNKLPFIC